MTAPIRKVVGALPAGLRSQLRRGAKLAYWTVTPHHLGRRVAFLKGEGSFRGSAPDRGIDFGGAAGRHLPGGPLAASGSQDVEARAHIGAPEIARGDCAGSCRSFGIGGGDRASAPGCRVRFSSIRSGIWSTVPKPRRPGWTRFCITLNSASPSNAIPAQNLMRFGIWNVIPMSGRARSTRFCIISNSG